MLKLDDVALSLGARHWKFNITLQPETVYALLGRSGSGKSTLLNIIAGFLDADEGSLTWKGKTLSNLEPAQRPITTLFQSNNLFSHLTVYQNIGLGIKPNLKLSPQQANDIHTVLEQVGLAGFEHKLPTSLSGGEQQRVALARCLLRRQPILLLDEPFSALDSTTRQEMIELLSTLVESFKPCVIMVTHDEADAQAMNAHRLLMHQNGIDLQSGQKNG